MVDRFEDGLPTPTETASYLEIPQSTLTSWLKGRAAGTPLVHQVEPVRKDRPSVPFIAVVERLDAHRDAIHRAVEKGGPAAYAV
ncbi:hypothetical protein [Streptomyces kebangsaanensis]|uniref:hypothetical protein n=1 Tax=Streptomyces kebangsaanensis TaxID=864058 RepID=UPI00093AFB12|nr:hypothetical protein [Streptomyces kebangsaanensis]